MNIDLLTTQITENLAKQLNTKGLSARNLWLFRQFYLAYPQIGLALHVPGEKLLTKLSFTHFKSLLPIEAPLQRTIYRKLPLHD